MNDPERLLDHPADDFERHLFASAAGDVGSPAARARCIAAVGAGLLPLHASAATSGSVVAALAGKSLAVGLALGAVVSGTSWLVTSSEAPSSVPHASNQPERTFRKLPATDRALGSSEGPPVESRRPAPAAFPSNPSAAREGRERTTPAEPARVVDASMPSTPSVDHTLDREIGFLDRARRALARGDAAHAAAELDGYQREFAAGALHEESLVLRVECLLRTGRRAEAESIASHFLAARPTGAHARRLRELLEP